MFDDSLDWVLNGTYLLAWLGGAPLAPLHMLREPGFPLMVLLDQLAGGGGWVIIPVLSACTFGTVYFVVKTIRLLVNSPAVEWLAVLVFCLHPGPALLRLFILADPMALCLQTISFYYVCRWLLREERGLFFKAALFAALAGLTQKYGLLPFILGVIYQVAERGWANLSRRQLLAGLAIAVLPGVIYHALVVPFIPHAGTPIQSQLLNLNLSANWGTYLHLWGFHFWFLLPLALLLVLGARAWIDRRIVTYALAAFLCFQALAYFYQSDDGRFVTYGYSLLLAALGLALGLIARRWAGKPLLRLLLAFLVFCCLALFVKTAIVTPSNFLRPQADRVDPMPWPVVLVQARIQDRMGLAVKCPGSGGNICPELPPLQGVGTDKTYFFNYYRCLKTGDYAGMPPYQRSDQTRVILMLK